MNMEVSRLQEQSHPLGIPTGAFKGQLRTKRHISVYYIACWGDWRKDERNTAMLGELYIHSSLWHTHTHKHRLLRTLSYVNPSSSRSESPSYFFADLYVEGLTEVSTQSPNAQTQRIGSPLGWPSWCNALPICTLCCLGDHLGQTLTPIWPLGFVAPLLRLLGNMTTYTRPCQTHDWHIPAHLLHQHSHPRQQIIPKPRQMTMSWLPICSLVIFHMLRAHTHTCTCTSTHRHTHTHSVLSWEPLCQHKAGFILQ